MCRVKNRPVSNIEYFQVTHNICTEKSNELIIDLNLGHHEDYTTHKLRNCNQSDKEKLVTHDILKEGTHFHKVVMSED